jgi:hypothetical protein
MSVLCTLQTDGEIHIDDVLVAIAIFAFFPCARLNSEIRSIMYCSTQERRTQRDVGWRGAVACSAAP